MGYSASVLKVMIASPGDVAEERRIVTDEIYRWNDAHAESRNIILQPVKWETHSTPRLGQAPQAELNEQIAENADILIGIFGTRIGTATDRHVSGTVEEIKNHVEAGKSAKVYFSDAKVHPSEIDQAQYAAVQVFKEECKSWGLFGTYSDVATFQRDVKQHLDIELNAPRYRLLSSRQAASPQAAPQPTDDAMQLLMRAAQAKGIITVRTAIGPDAVFVEDEEFTDGSQRSVARWLDAVHQLDTLNYARQKKAGSGLYEVTQSGYLAAERFEAEKPLVMSARTIGPPDQQAVEIRSSKPIKLLRIEYLHSTDACIVSQDTDISGKEINMRLDHKKVVELNNSGRPDKNHWDHSGPAKLRLVIEESGKQKAMILPVHLEPKIVSNTNWVTLTGSANATF